MRDLSKLSQWYENLTEKSLREIDAFYSKDTFFKDPFNEVKGREKIEHIFRDMFNHLQNPHFVLIDQFQEGNQAFITWDFVFTIKDKTYTIHGSSHLKFNGEGLINYHRDYWDVGEELLLKLPFIKTLYSMLRKKMGSSSK